MATVYKRGGSGNRGGRWYIAYFDHKGERQVQSARTTDKAAAERIAAKLEADAALRREGVIDPVLETVAQESRRTIESQLDDYKARLIAAQCCPKHIRNAERAIRAIVGAAGWVIVSDVTADGVNRYARKLREQKKRSPSTIHGYLTAIKGFTKWLAANHKLPRDPLANVKKPNPNIGKKRPRRMLLPEEWQWLRDTTATGSFRHDMSATERVLLYAIAIQTGLRSNELRSLTKGQLFLDRDPPFVTCEAGSTKNRKTARQYIHPDLADQLLDHLDDRPAHTWVFRMPHETDVSGMLRADLAAARAAWLKAAGDDHRELTRREESDFLCPKNHEGKVLDFHSLRHTCGAWLAMAGAQPKAVQAIMRHSSIVLTMDTYGHLFPGQEAETISRLPRMMGQDVPAAPVAALPQRLAAALPRPTVVASRNFGR